MSDEEPIARERYELTERPPWKLPVGRRAFFGLLGGGVGVLTLVRPAPAQRGRGPAPPAEVGAWIHIAEDGTVTAFTGKAEVGQEIRTSLTQAVAEELLAPLASIRLVMADTALVPFDQGTFGSRTTPAMAPLLRRAAATAREHLLDLAAERWKVNRAQLVVADGQVRHPPSDKRATFGELTRGQKLLATVKADTPLRPASAWKVAGSSVPKVDGRAAVTGERRFTSDLRRPDALVGKVLRPPRFGATLASVDGARLRTMKGTALVQLDGFAGVVAPDEQTATRALAALRPRWTLPTAPAVAAAGLFAALRGTVPPPLEALGRAVHRLDRTYTNAYIAHVPLEPRAALAEWQGDKLTVWTGTQRPFGVRGELAQALGISPEQVRVIVPDTGAGYGGKHSGEVAVEAARLARAAGKPVRLVWTREEEMTWAYFRPAGVMEIRSGLDDQGNLLCWEAYNHNAGGSGLRTPYDVADKRESALEARSPLRQGSYRALAATANHFAREVHMDELAALAKADPLAFRLRHLTREPRLSAVLRAAAERFGWEKAPPPGAGHGLACGMEKGGYVATCVEARVEAGAIRVARAVTAFECGAVVNPDHLRSQIEGCVVMGLGGALFEAIDFADGRIRNPRLSAYRVPRFLDMPVMETVIVDRKDLPSAGAGETPIVAIAPAIANALAGPSGRRLRDLPLEAALRRGKDAAG